MINRGLWRNVNCQDIDFEVIDVPYVGPRYVKAKVLYVYRKEGHPNIGGRPIFSSSQTVKIHYADMKNWTKLNV